MVKLDEILGEIPSFVRVVAVSKYVGSDKVESLFHQGQVEFGENRVQDLAKKADELKNLPIKWHFIGNLQSNKINQLLRTRPTLWQSCNSLELAMRVDKRLEYTLDTLLEVNVADEESKSGASFEVAKELFLEIKESCKNLNLQGIMCMGAHSDDEKIVAKSFEKGFKIYSDLEKYGAKICSMGMSSDYKIALKCGSNMLRLGSILFK